MIKGFVNAFNEAIIILGVIGGSGEKFEFEVVVDTGFNGALTLTPDIIRRLDLSFHTCSRAILADGKEDFFYMYEGEIEWDGKRCSILIDEVASAPLIGMSLLYSYELNIQVEEEGNVQIKKL